VRASVPRMHIRTFIPDCDAEPQIFANRFASSCVLLPLPGRFRGYAMPHSRAAGDCLCASRHAPLPTSFRGVSCARILMQSLRLIAGAHLFEMPSCWAKAAPRLDCRLTLSTSRQGGVRAERSVECGIHGQAPCGRQTTTPSHSTCQTRQFLIALSSLSLPACLTAPASTREAAVARS